ncbi:MAG: hypothetical protein Ta2F_07120 [Termitinemataceae bacterium]|nr:MAG: hypothetical protein Ta2F_07120 [Termitinemataceae bacterium]
MKETFIMYAKYIEDKDKKIIALLDGLSNAEREKDRGSYYKSLSGIFRHASGGMAFFLDMLKGALPEGSKAKAVVSPNAKDVPEGELNESQWKDVCTLIQKSNHAFLEFVTAITNAELSVNVKWFSGDMVPLSFMINALLMHQTHHSGQISQILDELKIDNDFSGISPKFI